MTWPKEPKRKAPHAHFAALPPRPLFTQTKPPVPVEIKRKRGRPVKKIPLNPGRA